MRKPNTREWIAFILQVSALGFGIYMQSGGLVALGMLTQALADIITDEKKSYIKNDKQNKGVFLKGRNFEFSAERSKQPIVTKA